MLAGTNLASGSVTVGDGTNKSVLNLLLLSYK